MNLARFAMWCAVAGGTLTTMKSASSLQSTRTTQATEDRPALSPAEALASFVLEPGYRIDLVAAEPLVQSPVAIAFDDRGRMYVAENRGYPDPLEGGPSAAPQGVIALLTDTDGDGRYDARTDFATGLKLATSHVPGALPNCGHCAPLLHEEGSRRPVSAARLPDRSEP